MRTTEGVIVEMLPSLPKPFSRQTLLDRWPEGRRPSPKHLSDTLRALYIRRIIQIARFRPGGRENLYDAIPMPEPAWSDSHRVWEDYKREHGIGKGTCCESWVLTKASGQE